MSQEIIGGLKDMKKIRKIGNREMGLISLNLNLL